MSDGKILIEKLIRYSEKFLHLNNLDEEYIRNLLLKEFNIETPYNGDADFSEIEKMAVPDELVSEIIEYAKGNSVCAEGEEELFAAHIFGLLSPLPSEINAEFFRIKEESGISSACKYLYDISVMNWYVRKTDIDKNLKWEFKDGDNVLEITINLSKPEKDNKDIAKLLSLKNTGESYPACALCKENEGFKGNLKKPPRSNLRTVTVNLGCEEWFVQYSPYAYYTEHCIAINRKHSNMNVGANTCEKLFDFTDIFPNYFIGSNADLPIVGGSILNHEHFQGGGHILPMRKAPIKYGVSHKKYPLVSGGVLDWYNSALRFTSKSRESLSSLGAEFISFWKSYTDEEVNIFAEKDGKPHNTLSPIASKNGDEYTLELILRNNITTKEYPDGLFHAHPEYFNIKKEGIGLIEAMGLFILPGRLKRQTSEIEKILMGERKYCGSIKGDDELVVHSSMIKELTEKFGTKLTAEEAHGKVVDYINGTCKSILECTAVFKNDGKGDRAFKKCLGQFGFEIK